MVNKNYYVWVEIEANKERVINEKYFNNIMDKCVEAGLGSIILAVKDTTGFGIYNSSVVPHYSKLDSDFKEKDYLQEYIEMAHSKGLKLYAGVDVFAEGRVGSPNKLSPGFIHQDWQSCMYGVDEDFNPVIRSIGNLQGIRTTGSIDDFHEIFVNPAKDEVRNYEKSIIEELVKNYELDGIVLDRVRFVGLGADFSDYTKDKFEEYIGSEVENWPQDIYTLVEKQGEIEAEFGHLFGKWIAFRASLIKRFIVDIKNMMDELGKEIELVDYTGSWYPLYYLVGANWARAGYIPEEYPWVDEKYGETGYAEYLNKLLSGFYYEDVTIAEAKEHEKPAYWYSVEGSGDMLKKVVGDSVPFAGSLFLKQYEKNPEQFKKAIEMCFKKSSGCMLFDLSYIEDYDWWKECKVNGECL